MRYRTHPDAATVIDHVRGAIRSAVRQIDDLESDPNLTVEDDFGVRHLDLGALDDSADGADFLTIIGAAEGISLAWSDDERTVLKIANLAWARENLNLIAAELSAVGRDAIELPHDERRSHIRSAVLRAIERGGTIELHPEVATEPVRLRGTDLLDDQQQSAVNAPASRDLLVNAGAGSGKTHMLTMRIARLVAEGLVNPERCTVLTFSRAAREQIQERLNAFALAEYPSLSRVDVRTIHSLGLRVLRLAAGAGKARLRPGFHIVADGRRQLPNGQSVGAPLLFIEQYDRLFEGVADGMTERQRLSLYPAAVNAIRSGHPELGVVASADQFHETGLIAVLDPRSGEFRELDAAHLLQVWTRYEAVMAGHNAIDFAGMVAEALVAIRAHPALARIAAAPYEHIFVDEFQDTSRAQVDLLFEIAAHGAVLSCVGDGDQTIFSFAGADPASLTAFASRLHARTGREPTVLPLESNYRSVPGIVDAAESVIARNTNRLSKRMNAVREASSTPGPVVTRAEGALRYGAPWLALQVRQLLDRGIEPGNIAVLFRKEGNRSPQESTVLLHLEKLGVLTTTEAQDADGVRVISIHQAKGSEFDHVLCLFLGADHFPDTRGDPEEERRLLYVALTRAKESFTVAGEPGGEPDLFEEIGASAVDLANVTLGSLADVLVLGTIDESVLELTDLGHIDPSILDWDEPMNPES